MKVESQEDKDRKTKVESQEDKDRKTKVQSQEGKDRKKKLLGIFEAPEPEWGDVVIAGENGYDSIGKQKPFLTTRCFVHAFLELQVRDTEYIKNADVPEFLNMIFADVDAKEVDIPTMKSFVDSFVKFFQFRRRRWTAMIDLYKYLEELMVSNYLSNYRGRLRYSSVDVMQIWTHYNKDSTMTLDKEEATTFVFDLLQQTSHRCNPRIIKTVVDKLISLSQEAEDEITLRGLTRVLPLEKSIMDQYENLQDLNLDDQTRILTFYDQDDEGQISGCELYALIKDVLEANGQEDPYNMEVILQTEEYLKQEGAISPMGNLDKKFLNIFFRLGLKETSL